MDTKQKVNVFAESCKRLLDQEVAKLDNEINQEIETQIKDEINEYQTKEELTYQKKLEKMEKDFNKEIYSLEIESKKAILDEKKNIQKELKNEVEKILIEFTQKPEYKEFLINSIEEVSQKVKNKSTSILSIIETDKERYGNELKEKYGIDIKSIDNKYIGGCILEDKIQGIYIDNTILNSINEKIN